MGQEIYHIVEEQDWEAQANNAAYVHPSLELEGFIHCSTSKQVEKVLKRYFTGKTNLLKLVIDPSKVGPDLKYEEASDGDKYPHVFGPLNKDSIVRIEKL